MPSKLKQSGTIEIDDLKCTVKAVRNVIVNSDKNSRKKRWLSDEIQYNFYSLDTR